MKINKVLFLLVLLVLVIMFVSCVEQVSDVDVGIEPPNRSTEEGNSEGDSDSTPEDNDPTQGNSNSGQEGGQTIITPIDNRPKSVSSSEAALLANLPLDKQSSRYCEKPITQNYNANVVDINISTSGVYQMNGAIEGSIIIDTGLDVDLILNNATITAENKNAIVVGKDSVVTITSLDGTQNSIYNSGVDAKGKGLDAISAKGQIVINGSGQLSITSDSKSAIKTSGDLNITETNLKINSSNHGLSAKTVYAAECEIVVENAKKDGINVDDSIASFSYGTGFVYFENVTYRCNSKGDGIQAASYIYIKNSQINIKTEGTFVEYSTENITKYELETKDYAYNKEGDDYYKVPKDLRTNIESYYALSQGCRGIRVAGFKDDSDSILEGAYYIELDSNTININSTDDSISCKQGSVCIKECNVAIVTKDSGIDSDFNTTIYSGVYDINSYEAICGAYIDIYNGTYNLVVRDDGINASTDDDAIEPYIIINDGIISINVTTYTGDAIDANGKILIKGGTIYAYTCGQEGLDSDAGTWLDGGTFVGVVFMAIKERVYQEDQTLSSCIVNVDVPKNTKVSLKVGENELFCEEAKQEAHIVLFASDVLKEGDIVKVFLDDALAKEITIAHVIQIA